MPFLFLALFWFWAATGPEPILLLNPSFEDLPGPGRPASGWYACGADQNTPPDIHPSGRFQITRSARHGLSFAGMVVRDDGSTEAMGQKLARPLRAGQCYALSLFLARSPRYQSISPVSREVTLFNKPARLRIWGSARTCARHTMLAQSPPVEHEAWVRYTFYLEPEEDMDYILFESAFAVDKPREAYCGNVLLDGCSPIFPLECGQEASAIGAPPVVAFDPDPGEDLASFLAREASGVAFSPGTAALLPRFYRDPEDGTPRQENLPLHRIVRATMDHPKTRLIAVLRHSEKALRSKRAKHLAWQLGRLGLPPARYEVRSWRRRDRHVAWTGVNTSRDLYLLVENLP